MSKTWNDIVARTFSSTTVSTLEEGYWKVIIDMVEKISFDGKEFEERKLDAMSIDKDFARAYETALKSLVNKYQDETKGFSTLFFELLLDDKENDNTKADEDTKS